MPTDPEPDELGAGRELDWIVAERVFGHETFRCTDTIHAAGVGCLVWRYHFRSEEEPDHVSAEPGVPPYSTDIASAWLVVAKMQEIGLTFVISGKYFDIGRSWFEANFEGEDWERMERGETVPLAICRAALTVMAMPDEEESALQGPNEPLAARGRGSDDGRGGSSLPSL